MLSPKMLIVVCGNVVCTARIIRKGKFLLDKRGSSHPRCLSFDQATFFVVVVLVSRFVEAAGMRPCC